MAGIEKKILRDLTLQDKNIFIIGLIIGKSEPNIFLSKRTEEYNGVLTFTVRDNKRCFINLKVWGTKERIDEYNRKFHLFDIIDIICPKIVSTSLNSENQFEPTTSMPYCLIINQDVGCIEPHLTASEEHSTELKELQNIPLKPLSGILSLADIKSGGIHSAGQFVDLLVCVRYLKPIKEVKSKSGNMMQCLELVVIDKSLLSGIALTIWNRGWIQRISQFWEPLKTVLHLIDVRVGYSTFYKTAVLGLSSRSLLVENPNSGEANKLRNFIEITPLPDSDVLSYSSFDLPSAESITTVMTVQKIYDNFEDDSSDQFTAVLYAMITKFDIDGVTSIFGRKCKSCKKRMNLIETFCMNENCQMQFSFNHSGDKFDYYFDINIQLTDHTGTLIEPRLTNQVAEKILDVDINEFLTMTDEQKTALKWKFLMSRFAAKLLMKKKSAVRNRNAIIVVDLETITLKEVIDKILIY